MTGGSIGRKVVNVAQKARGREPIKYELEVIPYTAWEIPPEHTKLLFAWERGSKLFVTDAEDVRANRSVVWKQFLKQTVTMYRGPDGFEAKDFAFKLQSVKVNSKGQEDRKTVAKIHVDLSTYCTGQVNPQPVEKTFTLKPYGKLKVSIRASWLKDAKFDPETMTELSGPSMFTDGLEQQEEFEGQEQDLSGFHSNEVGEDGIIKPKRARRKKNGRSRNHLPQMDSVPDDEGAEEPEEPLPRRKPRPRTRPRQDGMDDDGGQQGAAGTSQMSPDIELDVGVRIAKKTWRDYLCCCLQPKVVAQAVETQEGQELLSQPKQRSDRRYAPT